MAVEALSIDAERARKREGAEREKRRRASKLLDSILSSELRINSFCKGISFVPSFFYSPNVAAAVVALLIFDVDAKARS